MSKFENCMKISKKSLEHSYEVVGTKTMVTNIQDALTWLFNAVEELQKSTIQKPTEEQEEQFKHLHEATRQLTEQITSNVQNLIKKKEDEVKKVIEITKKPRGKNK